MHAYTLLVSNSEMYVIWQRKIESNSLSSFDMVHVHTWTHSTLQIERVRLKDEEREKSLHWPLELVTVIPSMCLCDLFKMKKSFGREDNNRNRNQQACRMNQCNIWKHHVNLSFLFTAGDENNNNNNNPGVFSHTVWKDCAGMKAHSSSGADRTSKLWPPENGGCF